MSSRARRAPDGAPNGRRVALLPSPSGWSNWFYVSPRKSNISSSHAYCSGLQPGTLRQRGKFYTCADAHGSAYGRGGQLAASRIARGSFFLAPTGTASPTGAAVNSPPTGSLAVAFLLRRRVRLRLYPRRSTCHYPCADAHGSAYAHSGQRAARRIARGNRCRAHAATRVTPGAGVAGGVPVADIAVPARER